MIELPLDLNHEPADFAEAKEMLRRARAERDALLKVRDAADAFLSLISYGGRFDKEGRIENALIDALYETDYAARKP